MVAQRNYTYLTQDANIGRQDHGDNSAMTFRSVTSSTFSLRLAPTMRQRTCAKSPGTLHTSRPNHIWCRMRLQTPACERHLKRSIHLEGVNWPVTKCLGPSSGRHYRRRVTYLSGDRVPTPNWGEPSLTMSVYAPRGFFPGDQTAADEATCLTSRGGYCLGPLA